MRCSKSPLVDSSRRLRLGVCEDLEPVRVLDGTSPRTQRGSLVSGYDACVPPPSNTKSLDAGAQLLEAAFDAPREQGRVDWRSMTAAVLKNRILKLTGRDFREQDWGASSFRGFLQLFSTLVDVDDAVNPPMVRWIGAATSAAESSGAGEDFGLGPHRRIRDDLWTAVLDYSSGQSYFWDGRGAVARPAEAENAPPAPRLPTLTREEFLGWRSEFVTSALAENPMAQHLLEAWRESEAGTAALPRQFRTVWIGELKSKVLSRLLDWFALERIDPPPNLVQDAPMRRAQDAQTEEIRELILQCVRVMSRSQLEELRLPADVVLRVRSN